ncbi:hypothetical protein [Halomonas denitrificans]|nr:hypothetical protein [Halomonas denitrificans]
MDDAPADRSSRDAVASANAHADGDRLDPERVRNALRAGAMESARPLARGNQGWVFGLSIDGRRLIVKTPAGGVASAVHRRALAREARAYARLQGLSGFATCHGLFDGRWLVLDELVARPYREVEPDDGFFDGLLQTIRAMHARGVAHGDLKRKSNLLVGDDGRPRIVDLGTAVLRRDRFAPLNHALFRTLAQTDLNAWVKLKYGGYEGIDEADRHLFRPTWPERIARRFRRR